MKYYFSLPTLLLILASLVTFSKAIRYTRCSLAKLLLERGVPEDDISKLVCIAEHGTNAFQTNEIGPEHLNYSREWGIFHIHDERWCERSGRFTYNECDIKCIELLKDDIRESLKCALKIKEQEGWTAFTTWKFCKDDLPSINDCFNSTILI